MTPNSFSEYCPTCFGLCHSRHSSSFPQASCSCHSQSRYSQAFFPHSSGIARLRYDGTNSSFDVPHLVAELSPCPLCLQEFKKRAELKVKIEMARFLQETVENMAVQASTIKLSDKNAEEYAAFLELLEKVCDELRCLIAPCDSTASALTLIVGTLYQGRTDGSIPTSEIVKFASLCDDVITLDNMEAQQLKAMCRMLALKPCVLGVHVLCADWTAASSFSCDVDRDLTGIS